MNTVMDDNKMLTLASNERIPLTPSMRLLLEINHMNHCSPATVSRGGVIFVNADDVGWKPVVDSWIERLEVWHSTIALAPVSDTLFCSRFTFSLLHRRHPSLCLSQHNAAQAVEYRPLLTTLFSRYVDTCLEHCRRNFKSVVPLPAVSQVRWCECL